MTRRQDMSFMPTLDRWLEAGFVRLLSRFVAAAKSLASQRSCQLFPGRVSRCERKPRTSRHRVQAEEAVGHTSRVSATSWSIEARLRSPCGPGGIVGVGAQGTMVACRYLLRATMASNSWSGSVRGSQRRSLPVVLSATEHRLHVLRVVAGVVDALDPRSAVVLLHPVEQRLHVGRQVPLRRRHLGVP